MSGMVLDAGARGALKTATKALIARLGGLAAAASVCRLEVSRLAECQGVNHPGALLPVDVVAQLEAVAEAVPVTAALARLGGCVLVPVEPMGAGALPELLARLGATVGGVFAASAEALADGHVDEAERVRLAAELSEMLAAGQAALGALLPKLPLRGGK
jgi:hypothetical protein